MIRGGLLSAWLFAGCSYHCAVTSTPAGAQLLLPDESTVTTPADLTLTWALFERPRVTASAVGYRTVTLRLRRSREIELVLVPDHGPAGTWTQDEVP